MESSRTRFVLSDAGPMRLMEQLDRYVRHDASHPITIVVPSQVLVRHVNRYLAKGGALVAVQVVTLHQLAIDVLEAVGDGGTCYTQVTTLLVGQALRDEPDLYAELRETTDKPHLALTGTISDLRHAGFRADHAEACIDALDDETVRQAHIDPKWLQRAKAVIHIAQAVSNQAQDVLPCTDLYTRAGEAAKAPSTNWGQDGTLCIYGFSDATGAALDFLETLTANTNTALFLDLPPCHTAPADGPNPTWSFTKRIQERLTSHMSALGPMSLTEDDHANTEDDDANERFSPSRRDVPANPGFSFLSAPNPRAEIRAVGLAIAQILDQGSTPESIAVVARDLSPYVAPIRTLFTQMGIPFSNPSDAPGLSPVNSGPLAPVGRQLKTLCDLLQQGSQTPVDLLLTGPSSLTSWANEDNNLAWSDLWLVCRILGVHRLADTADAIKLIDRNWTDQDHMELPIHPYVDPNEDIEDKTCDTHRCLPVATIRHWLERLATIDDIVTHWPDQTTFAEHRKHLQNLATEKLDWWNRRPNEGHRSSQDDAQDDAQDEFAAFFDSRFLSGLLPPDRTVSKQEFFIAIQAHLDGAGRTPLGGAGGGVQVMTVTQARACPFEHLFLVGLNKGLFPRPATEDLFLPDRVRVILKPLLPDLPLKMEGHTEDRYLFDQLLSTAPHVHLSWSLASNEETKLLASPLVEQLRLVQGISDDMVNHAPVVHPDLTAIGHAAPSTHGDWISSLLVLRDSADLAILSALANSGRNSRSSSLTALLDQADQEAIQGTSRTKGPNASIQSNQANQRANPTAARARLNILSEQDAHPDSGPGPYLGLVFEDNTATPWITRIEAMARCPWQTFLERVLHVEPPSGDSLDLEANLVGAAIHRALQLLVADHLPQTTGRPGRQPSGPTDLDEAVMLEPTPVPWPDPQRLEQIVDQACGEQLRYAGLDKNLLDVVLREQVNRLLEAAKTSDWAAQSPLVLGCELTGHTRIDGHTLQFRSDRVDRVADTVLLVDYKTGRRPTETKPEKMISAGRFQAMAYALARNDTTGRYLYLAPNLDDADRRIDFGPEEKAAHADTFEQRVVPLMDALAHGLFPAIPKDPRSTCEWCRMQPACLRLDTNLATRLDQWAEGVSTPETNQDLRPWQRMFAAMISTPSPTNERTKTSKKSKIGSSNSTKNGPRTKAQKQAKGSTGHRTPGGPS